MFIPLFPLFSAPSTRPSPRGSKNQNFYFVHPPSCLVVFAKGSMMRLTCSDSQRLVQEGPTRRYDHQWTRTAVTMLFNCATGRSPFLTILNPKSKVVSLKDGIVNGAREELEIRPPQIRP